MNAVVDWFNQYNKILVTLTIANIVVLLSLSIANVDLLILEELENTPATNAASAQTTHDNGQSKKNYGRTALHI